MDELLTDMNHPNRRLDLKVHELDGEALVYDGITCDTHRLNETALIIWNACDGRHSAADIAHRLAGQYSVAFEDAVSHVERTFQAFHQRRLIEVSE